jgi:hypothetical protein
VREKLTLYTVYLLLIVGLFFVFAGVLVPQPPVEVTKVQLYEESIDSEYMSADEIKELQEQQEEYTPNLQNENNVDIIPDYNISTFSEETQSDIMKLVNNETDTIQNTELYQGEFIINIEGESYNFKGENIYSDPIWISLTGYIVISTAAVLYIRRDRHSNNTDGDKEYYNNGIIKGGTDSKWEFIIDDDEYNEK